MNNEKIKVTGTVISEEAWNALKVKGDDTKPYRITILADNHLNTIDPNSPRVKKAFKIAFYQDGTHAIEEVK